MNQRCFQPECYRRAVPLLQKGSLPHRNTGYSWLPRGATSCPQLKKLHSHTDFSNQENNLLHARNEPRNHSKTQQGCVNRSILPRPLQAALPNRAGFSSSLWETLTPKNELWALSPRSKTQIHFSYYSPHPQKGGKVESGKIRGHDKTLMSE